MTREPKSWPLGTTFAAKGEFIVKRRQPKHRDPYGRPLEDKVEGAPRNFDAATTERLQAALKTFLLDRKARLGCLPLQKDPSVMNFIRGLMDAEGLESSDRIIARQIIGPVFKKLAKE